MTEDRRIVFYSMLEVSVVSLHACTKTLVPLVSCIIVSDALVDVTLHLLQTLFAVVRLLLDDAPDPVINRKKVRAVR